RSQYIERRDVRRQRAQCPQVLRDAHFVVAREAEDVGKVAGDSVSRAEGHDVGIALGIVLRLVRVAQRLPAEGLRADEYLETPGAGHLLDEALLAIELSVALHEERKLESLLDHRVEERGRVGN